MNTTVEMPHNKAVTCVRIRPETGEDDDQPMVVTTSQDGYFKTWTLVDDSNIYSMYFLSFLPYSTQIIGNVVVSLLMLYLNTVKLLLEIINIDISKCLKMVVSL